MGLFSFLHCISKFFILAIIFVEIRELRMGIGLWAMPEDIKEFEDGQAVRRASGFVGRGQGPITMNN